MTGAVGRAKHLHADGFEPLNALPRRQCARTGPVVPFQVVRLPDGRLREGRIPTEDHLLAGVVQQDRDRARPVPGRVKETDTAPLPEQVAKPGHVVADGPNAAPQDAIAARTAAVPPSAPVVADTGR